MSKYTGTKTEKNLLAAFAGESEARNKYTYWANAAKDAGLSEMARIFFETAEQEKEHGRIWFEELYGSFKDIEKNLLAAAESEKYEGTTMYKKMAQEAREEGFSVLAEKFEGIAQIESFHEERYRNMLEKYKENKRNCGESDFGWKCRNCGYIFYGAQAPEKCPICSLTYFEKDKEHY